MKTLKLFLLSLVVISTGIAHLEAMKRAEPDSGFDSTERIEVTQTSNNAQLSVNPDLIFAPHDPEYYAIIEQELDALKVYLVKIRPDARPFLRRYPFISHLLDKGIIPFREIS